MPPLQIHKIEKSLHYFALVSSKVLVLLLVVWISTISWLSALVTVFKNFLQNKRYLWNKFESSLVFHHVPPLTRSRKKVALKLLVTFIGRTCLLPSSLFLRLRSFWNLRKSKLKFIFTNPASSEKKGPRIGKLIKRKSVEKPKMVNWF